MISCGNEVSVCTKTVGDGGSIHFTSVSQVFRALTQNVGVPHSIWPLWQKGYEQRFPTSWESVLTTGLIVIYDFVISKVDYAPVRASYKDPLGASVDVECRGLLNRFGQC